MFPSSVFSIYEIIGLLGHLTVSMFQFMAGLILQAFWVFPKNPKQIYSHLGLKIWVSTGPWQSDGTSE